jgi:hypothetical protein
MAQLIIVLLLASLAMSALTANAKEVKNRKMLWDGGESFLVPGSWPRLDPLAVEVRVKDSLCVTRVGHLCPGMVMQNDRVSALRCPSFCYTTDKTLWWLAHTGSSAHADASAEAYVDDWKRGNRRAPTFSECDAAASASASSSAWSLGSGDAFSSAKADAEASGSAWGTPFWRDRFITACRASASAHAEASSNGGGWSGEACHGVTRLKHPGHRMSALTCLL